MLILVSDSAVLGVQHISSVCHVMVIIEAVCLLWGSWNDHLSKLLGQKQVLFIVVEFQCTKGEGVRFSGRER